MTIQKVGFGVCCSTGKLYATPSTIHKKLIRLCCIWANDLSPHIPTHFSSEKLQESRQNAYICIYISYLCRYSKQ